VKSLTAYYKFASIDLGKQFAGAYAGLAEQTERETGTGRNSEIIDADLITDGTAHYNAAAAAADRSGSGRPSEREDFNSNVFIMGSGLTHNGTAHTHTPTNAQQACKSPESILTEEQDHQPTLYPMHIR